jgi:hypothetical protein
MSEATHRSVSRGVERMLNEGRDIEIATQNMRESVAQVRRERVHDPLRIDGQRWGAHL